MIKSLLICDSQGFPFYSKTFDPKFPIIDDLLLSGLISAIETIGKALFNEEIATVSFGEGKSKKFLSIVTKF